MGISTTLNAILAVLAVLFVGHAFIVYKVHKASIFEYEFLDHRHQEGLIAKTRFKPVVITPQHFTSELDIPLYLPEALRYPLYSNQSAQAKHNPNGRCCEMLSIRGRNPRNIQCEGICHTERACVDKLYPFKSEQEAKFFTEKEWNATTLPALRADCKRMNMKLSPPYKWCQQWGPATKHNPKDIATTTKIKKLDLTTLEQYNHQNIYPLGAKLPPPGCSRMSEGGGSGAYQHLTLFPEAKLAFCGIPKISITQWLQFLRFTFGAKDYQVRIWCGGTRICING
jgi:hypothetical protein